MNWKTNCKNEKQTLNAYSSCVFNICQQTYTETRKMCTMRSNRYMQTLVTHSSPYRREPGGPRAEVGFPTADHGFSSIQGTLFGFRGIQIASDACYIYPHQARTNANDKMAANDYTFTTTSCTQKKYPDIDRTETEKVQKGAGSQLRGTWCVIRGSGSQIRGGGTDIRRDNPRLQFNPWSQVSLSTPNYDRQTAPSWLRGVGASTCRTVPRVPASPQSKRHFDRSIRFRTAHVACDQQTHRRITLP